MRLKYICRWCFIVIFLSFLMAACQSSASEDVSGTVSIDANQESTVENEAVATAAVLPTLTLQPTPTFVPLPTDTPEPQNIEYVNERAGISLSYPIGWSEESYSNAIVLASSRELLDGEGNGEGAIVYFNSRSSEEIGVLAPQAFFAVADEEQRFMGISNPFTRLEQTNAAGHEIAAGFVVNSQTLPTDGLLGANVLGVEDDFGEGVELTIFMAVISNQPHHLIMFAATPTATADMYLPAFSKIAESITLSEMPGSLSRSLSIKNSFYTASLVDHLMFRGDSVRGPVLRLDPSPANVVTTSWHFMGVAGERIDIRIVTETQQELEMTIANIDPGNTDVLFNGAVPGDGVQHELSNLEVPSSGIYQVIIKSGADERGDYLFTLAAPQNEAFVSLASVWPKAIVSNEGILSTIGENQEIGLVAIDSPSIWDLALYAGSADIMIDNQANLSLTVDVVDGDGISQLASGPVSSSDSQISLTNVVPSETGLLYLIVATDSPIGGSYQLTVTEN